MKIDKTEPTGPDRARGQERLRQDRRERIRPALAQARAPVSASVLGHTRGRIHAPRARRDHDPDARGRPVAAARSSRPARSSRTWRAPPTKTCCCRSSIGAPSCGRSRASPSFADRYKTSSSLIYIDLNNFKTVNDAHGHAAGDEVLRHIADLILGQIREFDVFARIGGDEFGVILAHVTADQAAKRRESGEGAARSPAR